MGSDRCKAKGVGGRRRTAVACVVVALLALSLTWVCGRVLPRRLVDPSDGAASVHAGDPALEGGSPVLPDESVDILTEQLGDDVCALIGEGVTRSLVAGDVPSAAEESLREYQSDGGCVLVQAGYLDLVGDVWSCTVQGDGWVEVTVVRSRVEGGSEVTTIHMDAGAWERELSSEERGE